MLDIAIIGFGGMGRGRLGYYRQIPGARVTAVADIRAADLRRDATLADEFELPYDQVAWYDDYHRLIADGRIDAVDICLPTSHHPDAAVSALQAGLHVLCEKPMALTLAECDAMVAAAESAQRTLMIAQCVRFWPEYEYLAGLIRTGEAGRLLSLQMSRQGPLPAAGRSWFCRQELSGGALLDLHIHDLDFCHHALGMPTKVYTQAGESQGPDVGFDYMLTNLGYDERVQVSINAQWTPVAIPFVASFQARFERAVLMYRSDPAPSMLVYRLGSDEPEKPEFAPAQTAYVNEISYFVDCASQGRPAERCLPQSTRDSVALAMSVRASASSRTVVSVGSAG